MVATTLRAQNAGPGRTHFTSKGWPRAVPTSWRISTTFWSLAQMSTSSWVNPPSNSAVHSANSQYGFVAVAAVERPGADVVDPHDVVAQQSQSWFQVTALPQVVERAAEAHSVGVVHVVLLVIGVW